MRTTCDGLREMTGDASEFERIVTNLVTRWCAQAGHPTPGGAEVSRLATQLRALVAERGLPQPLRDGESGAPGGMSEEACAPLVGRVVAGIESQPVLAEVARQLVKACFYPEFRVCRDSFRELSRDGSCRRQELSRVRSRISGTHCVDCPHWVALAPEAHAAFVVAEWHGDPAGFAAHRDIFLPEDFRALRWWLHAASRGQAD